MGIELPKIALFPPSLEGGGVSRVVLNLAEGFVDAGFAVDMVMLTMQDEWHSLFPDGVQLVDLQAGRAITSMWPLRRYLLDAQPDILLPATEPVNLAAVWARALARRADRNLQTRLILTEMNTPSQYFKQVRVARERFYPMLARRFYPRAEFIVAIAEAIREDMIDFFRLEPRAISTIFSPVITPNFYERLSEPVEHVWLKDERDVPVILAASNFYPQKGLITLLQAFELLIKKRAAKLIMLGDGPLRAELEALVESLGLNSSVSMPGFRPNLPYMRTADVFVMSSIFEGLPTVLVEALACSRAIVSTDHPGGAREILDHGRAGRLVPMRDPQALADGIIAALDDPIDTTILRQRAELFEMRSVIQAYRDLIRL